MVEYYIDQPNSWTEVPDTLIVKGWCFGAHRQPVKAVRLLTDNMSFTGTIGLPRPDVSAAIPNAPGPSTGFDVRGILHPGSNHILIEAQTTDGTWHPILDKVVRVRENWHPLWLPGSSWTRLMFFQMAGHMKYAPRPLVAGPYPRATPPQLAPPKLSVVTPSFQQAHFLSETLRSVLGQREDLGEYVIQDGGSTDGSADVFQHVIAADNTEISRNAAIWISEPDNGQADAIARAFSKTTGRPEDLMAWTNSDDFYLPGSFAYIRRYFRDNPDVDVVYGHRILVDEKSKDIGRWFLPPHDNFVLRLNDFVPQETMFWRRRIWDKVGGIDTSFKFAMDWDLLLRFHAAGARIVRVPYFLACFRIHSAQKTTAQMETVGQKEIDALRLRTFGRVLSPTEIENHPRLIRYLRKSAWIEFLWRRFGIRHP